MTRTPGILSAKNHSIRRAIAFASPFRSRRALALLSIALLWGVGEASAAETISLNQKRMQLRQLVERVGVAAERTILLPDDVRGTISIVAKRPVTIDEAWSMLETSISMLGYSLLPSTVGNWRVAKVADAVGEAPFIARQREGGGDAFVTTLIPLRSAVLSDILKVIEPLAGSRVILVPYEATNSMIAAGPERAIARLTTIADELDRVEEKTLRQRVLRYRNVDEVEPMVEGYLDSNRRDRRNLQVWSDARTNSLVVRGPREGVERVIGFLDEIDQPIEGEGAIRILRILNRDAEDVAEIVRSMSGSPGAAGAELARSATALDGADYSIAVDSPSRSLVIRADPETHRAIRELVERLDDPPQLIAIDVTVSRLSTPEAYGLSFGFLLPFASGNDADDIFGFIRSAPSLEDVNVIPTVFGQVQRDTQVAFETTGPDGEAISVPILQSGTIGAGDFEARNEVLIQPSLVITAGETHEIFVGNNIPIPVTESSPLDLDAAEPISLASISRTTRFDRRDIGTRVEVEARAGKKGKIRLDLDIELSGVDFTRAALGGDPALVGPSYIDQTLAATAQLEDGETAVLAVDSRRKENVLNSGVPFLRDLPFFGWAFRTKANFVEDVRLIIAVRARRVSNPSELVADTIRRRLAFERRSARMDSLPGIDGSPYGVRVTTRSQESDAVAISEGLALRGYRTTTHAWSASGADYYDVYVTGLDSMVDAAEVAASLSKEGWDADLVVLSSRS